MPATVEPHEIAVAGAGTSVDRVWAELQIHAMEPPGVQTPILDILITTLDIGRHCVCPGGTRDSAGACGADSIGSTTDSECATQSVNPFRGGPSDSEGFPAMFVRPAVSPRVFLWFTCHNFCLPVQNPWRGGPLRPLPTATRGGSPPT